MYTATYSPEDNKLRLYSVGRLDAATYERVRAAGFKWAPKQELWVAPCWTPAREDLLLELCGEIGDEDKSLVDRAEERAERFEGYQESRAEDAASARAAVDRITSGIPLGQPILVGHHSERHARKDAERIENGMRKAIKMWETSQYWKARAAGAVLAAKYKERPDVRHRRIKGLESDLRKQQKTVKQAEGYSGLWRRGDLTPERAMAIANYDHIAVRKDPTDMIGRSLWSELRDEKITVEAAVALALQAHERTIAWANRWIAHIENRLGYERAMLGESGGIPADRFDIQPGGRVLVSGGLREEWVTVVRVTRKAGKVVSVRTNARYVSLKSVEEIRDYKPPTAEEAAAVAARTKLAPLTNCPSPGGHEMTKAEWHKTYRDYKATRTAAATEKHGAYRYRTVIHRGALVPVFIKDAKRVDPPAPAAVEAAPAVTPPVPSVPVVSRLVARPADADADAVAAMRTQLRTGVQAVSSPSLFPTPRPLAGRMADLAGIQPQHAVLEPSAGTGHLVDAIRARCPGVKIAAVEVSGRLAAGLGAKLGEVVIGDFLSMGEADLGTFDRVVMNPPFDNGVDIKHVEHARALLRKGGLLVGICADGPRQQKALRPEVEASGGIWEPLPAGTFEGTSVRAVLFTLGAKH